METTPRILEIGQAFMEALSVRDFERLQTSFQEGVQFRALMPTGIRGALGAAEAVLWLRRWFGDADEFEVLNSSVDLVANRLHFVYSFRLHKHGEWQIIDQEAYCTVSDSQIDVMYLVSSGFRAERQIQTEIHAHTVYDPDRQVIGF
jgi:hypothetical protein